MSLRRRFLLAGLALLALALGAIAVVGGGSGSDIRPGKRPLGQASCGPPPLHLGLDAYRRLDRLSYLELGPRTWGHSTADPGGSNNDNRQLLRVMPDGQRVLFEQQGPGIVTFLRHQEAIGAPWRLQVDGRQVATVAAADLGQADPADFPSVAFPYPLSLNADQTPGSSIVAASIPFTDSIRWTAAAPNGNFYALYRKLPHGTPVVSWTGREAVEDVVELLRRAGADLAPSRLAEERGTVHLPAGDETTLVDLNDGPRQVRALNFWVPHSQAAAFGNARLRIWWDEEAVTSVDAPLKMVTGAGAGVYLPAGRPLVDGLLSGIRADDASPPQSGLPSGHPAPVRFDLYWPMPFRSTARIAVTSPSGPLDLRWSVRHEPFPDPAPWGTFRATYSEHPAPRPGEDLVFLDVSGSGRIVGTVVNFSRVGPTLEGDPRIYLDDSHTPQIAVTGTEEWGLGGNYWRNGRQTTLPLGGLPSSTDNPPGADVDGAALYRFLIADSIAFNRRATIRWEHGPSNESPEPYRAAVLWYGTPVETAIPSDELRPGDPASRAKHDYASDSAREYDLTSAPAHVAGSPASTAKGVSHTTSSSFTLSLHPRNVGAFLRRTLDYGVPNQTAHVFIDGEFAGTWYNPGSFDGPGADAQPHRGRDDELPLPPALTADKSSIRVEIRVVPTTDPPNRTWTEFAYRLYSLVPPGCEK